MRAIFIINGIIASNTKMNLHKKRLILTNLKVYELVLY